MIYYGTATWFPTILVSKGFTLSNAGFAVSLTGLLGSIVGIAAPYYSSKLSDLRSFLAITGGIITLCLLPSSLTMVGTLMSGCSLQISASL